MAGLVLIVTFAGDIFCSRHVVHPRESTEMSYGIGIGSSCLPGVDHISASSMRLRSCMCSTLLVGMYSLKLLSTLPYFANIARSST